jgi:hypothetical protein
MELRGLGDKKEQTKRRPRSKGLIGDFFGSNWATGTDAATAYSYHGGAKYSD